MSSVFLQGSYAPISVELDSTTLPVSGELPRALHGRFLRNGPNPAYEPEPPYRWFGGDGMVHGIWLADGRAQRYRNRWVKTFGLQLERRAGRCLFPTLGIPREPVAAMVERGEMVKNAANTHVIRHAGKWLCLFESGEPYEINEELETVGAYRFNGQLPGPMTAHPKLDPVTGELHFFGYSPFPPYLRYYRAGTDGAITHCWEIELPRPVMMHDFAITDQAAIFIDAPVVFDLQRALHGGAAYQWEPQHGLRLGVMPFDNPQDIRWYHAPDTGFSFHTYNAWREGNRTVLVCGRKERMDFDGAPTDKPEALWRYTIDPLRQTVRSEQLDDLHAVLPRIDERRIGRPTRFGYATTVLGHTRMIDWDGIVQFDLHSGARRTYQWPAGAICGEAVFAADPARDGELDGWLLQLVQNPQRHATDLCVLEAANIEAGPVARVHLPLTVPNGFHGSWLPDEAAGPIGATTEPER